MSGHFNHDDTSSEDHFYNATSYVKMPTWFKPPLIFIFWSKDMKIHHFFQIWLQMEFSPQFSHNFRQKLERQDIETYISSLKNHFALIKSADKAAFRIS